MRHVLLTCTHHPDLRWMTKEIAWSDARGYNGCRGLTFHGSKTNRALFDAAWRRRVVDADGKTVGALDYHPTMPGEECACPVTDLVRAPEDLAAYPAPETGPALGDWI